jgi:hypothetical protein
VHATRREDKGTAYRILVGKSDGKSLLERPWVCTAWGILSLFKIRTGTAQLL